MSHQGQDAIVEYFKRKTISTFTEKGEEVNMKMVVKRIVEQCEDCQFVAKMKSENPSENHLIQIKESDIPAVLKYADKTHGGFRDACKRIKWSDFPGFENKVRTLYNYFDPYYYK